MAFLSKLFGKKDKDESKKEEIELDGLFDEKEEDRENIELDDLFEDEEDGGEGLTDEEIAAAEAFEAENREEFENATSLDVDGEFVDYESLIPEDEDVDDDELSDGENEEGEKYLYMVSPVKMN